MPASNEAEAHRPFYSVVIPTYRRNNLLLQALDSVNQQTFDDYEIIVVDDDANPDTRALVESLGDERVSYFINQHTSGGSGARNFGLAQARGEWVAFLDDDDTWLPTKLEKVHTAIAASTDSKLGLVYSGNEKYDFERGLVVSRKMPKDRGMILSRLLYENCIGGMSVVVAKRQLLLDVGGFDERFPAMQDMELFVRLGEHNSFDFVDEALVKVRWSNRERITFDPQKKLQGARLFAEKYDRLMRNDLRLRHRAASRTFVFAVAAKDYGLALRSLPWTAAGLVVDPDNLLYVVRALVRQFRSRRLRAAAAVRAPAR